MITAATPHVRYAIAVDDVWKRYGAVAALQGASIHVARGSAVGLVGPNGAGKSSLLRLLCGVARADSGIVHLDGLDPHRHPVAAKQRLGYMPDLPALFELLTGAEQLAWVGRLRRVPDDILEMRIRELSSVLDLTGSISRSISTYSRGMRQKLAFAAALVHDPRIVVLDEPFEGVDVLTVRAMKAVLQQYVEAGAAILLSSHILSLVEDVCDRFAVIADGRIVFNGDRQTLAREASRLTAGAGTLAPGHALESVLVSHLDHHREVAPLETLALKGSDDDDGFAS
jgi:ABC-2 type transport system ATP-binding protein